MIKHLPWLAITWMALKRNAVNGPVLLIFNFLWNRFISGCIFSFGWKHFHNSAFWVIQHFSKCPLSHWAWVKLNLWEIPCRNRKISESKPFKCSCHSYPYEALKRIFLFTNVAESRPFILVQNYRYGCFTLFRCANNARNWHLVGSHCLNISSQWEKGRHKNHYNQDQQMVFVVLLLLKKVTFILDRTRSSGKKAHEGANQPTGTAVVCCRLVASPLSPLLLLITCALQADLIFVIFTRMLRKFSPKTAQTCNKKTASPQTDQLCFWLLAQ